MQIDAVLWLHTADLLTTHKKILPNYLFAYIESWHNSQNGPNLSSLGIFAFPNQITSLQNHPNPFIQNLNIDLTWYLYILVVAWLSAHTNFNSIKRRLDFATANQKNAQ